MTYKRTIGRRQSYDESLAGISQFCSLVSTCFSKPEEQGACIGEPRPRGAQWDSVIITSGRQSLNDLLFMQSAISQLHLWSGHYAW